MRKRKEESIRRDNKKQVGRRNQQQCNESGQEYLRETRKIAREEREKEREIVKQIEVNERKKENKIT